VINRARRGADQFENSFWSGGDLAQLYRAIEQRGGTTGWPAYSSSDFASLRGCGNRRIAGDQLLEGARRAMRVAQLKEIDRLEASLATLATVGSTSLTSACSARCGNHERVRLTG